MSSDTGRVASLFNRYAPWILLVVVIVCLIGRTRVYLAQQSFWYDEAYLIRNIQTKDYRELLGPTIYNQAAPPIYMWTLKALYDLFGATEWAMRLPAFVAGILLIVMMYPLAKRFVGWPGAYWAVAFTAVSVHLLDHGNETKPYTIDALVTVVILWVFTRESTITLCILAAVCPWLSYPSVFTLGGVGLTLAIRAIRDRRREGIILTAIYGLIVAISAISVMVLVAKHQRTKDLSDYWITFYIDLSSFGNFISSSYRILLNMGDYCTTSLGIAYLIAVPIGWIVMFKKHGIVAAVFPLSLLLALIACAMKAYPLDNRLVLFAVSLFWIPAAAAIGSLVNRLHGIGGWCILAVLICLPLLDFSRFVMMAIPGSYSPEFREAFKYLNREKRDGDFSWQPYAEVYDVYHGTDPAVFNYTVPLDQVVSESAGHRLWLIVPIDGFEAGDSPLEKMHTRLIAMGWRRLSEQHFRGLLVILYEP